MARLAVRPAAALLPGANLPPATRSRARSSTVGTDPRSLGRGCVRRGLPLLCSMVWSSAPLAISANLQRGGDRRRAPNRVLLARKGRFLVIGGGRFRPLVALLDDEQGRAACRRLLVGRGCARWRAEHLRAGTARTERSRRGRNPRLGQRAAVPRVRSAARRPPLTRHVSR
jgi:hypothetical protein